MKYDAEITEIKRLSTDVEDFCARNSLNKDVEFALNLVLEEIFANICLHGYNGKGGKVDVEMSKSGGVIRIEISDGAPEFNPLSQAPAPDLISGIEEREIGGLGVHFIKNFTDEVSYKRLSGKNVLTILKNIPQMLEVKNLKIKFNSGGSSFEAVKGISFRVDKGESVAIVGESGSGKTVSAMSITRLLPPKPACEIEGEIFWENQNVLKLGAKELQKIRGAKISYIFQEPSASLNPVFSVGYQIAEAVKLHFPGVKNVKGEVVKALKEVGIRNAEERYNAYPHELSGGMQQRVMIAMALACRPDLLIADEPTTALDVTIQKQIIDLLKDVRKKRNMALMLITHNFGIISGLCDRVIVMFRGRIVEEGSTSQILKNPKHPYTKALISCIPHLGQKSRKLNSIDYSQIEAEQ
ncbi:MAG: ATP-binding cassette domain-containing protein [Opitutales bacterium]|nr:ATP-binding cassette domain-containing protein [Opitutales bacterium]